MGGRSRAPRLRRVLPADLDYDRGHVVVGREPFAERLAGGEDGVDERLGREFGSSRLIELVERSRELSPKALVDAIFDAVEAFREGFPPNDDMTAVVVKITG